MCLIIDKKPEYIRACKGFTINGITYKRLLGTVNGVKNSTIVFANEKILDELNKRIDNGRNKAKPIVPAKLEAYNALTCSASNPVSMPNGILVVNDAETEFKSDVIMLSDENDGEPDMEFVSDYEIKMDATDGFGLMLPSLAERWSKELGLDYVVSGVNTRFSFEKGMVFTFDFVDFAEKIANKFFVKDAWGNMVDIRNVELILTTSMLKLWDSYESCESYLSNCSSNKYEFSIAKTAPKELENIRNLNYQFIQSYDLSDEDIDELIRPTVDEIHDVLGGDLYKSILFLKGFGLHDGNIDKLEDDYIKAMMVDGRVMRDPFVRNSIYRLIKNRINEAKVGVIGVHGNYSIVSGDPFLLCQSIFELPLTGLLREGEIYNKYWADIGANNLACFRAPMTCHNNIRLVHPVNTEDAAYWYRHLKTTTVFNAWDTATAALNGCDFDGDIVMLTDNDVLVNKLEVTPTIMCMQRNAKKIVPTEDDLITSNINSFGSDIGQITNRITSMFEVRSGYDKGTPEYEELSYRIRCGQLLQQNAIDSAKGIVCKPMSKVWYDRHAVNKMNDDDSRVSKDMCRHIVADRKPYFMRYIYPALMKQYNTYIRNTNKNSLREFGLTVDELKDIPKDELTDRQSDFIKYYEYRMPVGTGDCVMNKICRTFENEFDGSLCNQTREEFDYSFMKSDEQYSPRQYSQIKSLYEDYNKRINSYAIFADYERVDDCVMANEFASMNSEFRKECEKICPNEYALCNIVLDICYTRNSTKRFAWSMCGATIIKNLLKKNSYTLSFPEIDPLGDISFGGERFSISTKFMEVDD